ncbi:MAG: MFS transporter, partial [Deltaproteobacteria bacterium]|nr:MFS transporter [Deltaproteobacteria bacterium]
MPEQDRSASRPPAYRWLVFGLLAAAYFMVYFHRTSPAVVALDMMSDLKASGALMGLLASAYFYPYALMQVPSGLLSDSWGPRRTITVFFLVAGLASVLFGLVKTPVQATAARVLVGVGVSMLFVPTMKVLTAWFKRSEFATMTGLLMTIGGLGALSAAAPLAYLSALLGWRGSFLVIGLGTLVLALAIWFLVRDRPQEKGFAPMAENSPQAGPSQPKIGLGQGVRLVLTEWRFWPLAIWFFCDFSFFFAFAGLWGGPFLMEVYGLTKAQAGQILSMMAVGMIVGSPSLSFISDRIVRSRKKVLVFSSVLVAVMVSILTFHPAGLSLAFLYVLCFFIGVFASAVVVIGFTAAKELFPLAVAGTSVGLV